MSVTTGDPRVARSGGLLILRQRQLPHYSDPRLIDLGKVPKPDRLFLQSNGPAVRTAAAGLKSTSTVPASDVAYLSKYGGNVAKAQKHNPGQRQTWWWICFACAPLFIPFVFLLTGRWSPRLAREDERAHEAVVERELARLREAPAASS